MSATRKPIFPASLLALLVLLTAPVTLLAADFETEVGTFLQTHCVHCHDQATQEGEFRVDTLSPDIGSGPSSNVGWR